jgi:hypothetical protein
MRTGEVSIPDDSFLMNEILKEADFYNLQGFIKACKEPKPALFPGSTLLTDETHQQKIVEWIPWNSTKYQLLYKASRDGWEEATFNNFLCSRRPTVAILLSKNGYLFGGYTVVPWSGETSVAFADDSVFLFTLTNPNGIKPIKFPVNVRNPRTTTVCCGKGAPFFEGGFNVKGQTCRFEFPGANYANISGYYEANLFTGSQETELSDMEVFQCIT